MPGVVADVTSRATAPAFRKCRSEAAVARQPRAVAAETGADLRPVVRIVRQTAIAKPVELEGEARGREFTRQAGGRFAASRDSEGPPYGRGLLD